MIRMYVLLVLSFSATSLFSQTLFTYGGSAVSKDEFLNAYNKNKTPVADKEKALREYLDLYTKFKLKVKAAQNIHLDTLQQLKIDVKSFRSQVEESYMNDEKKVNELIDEAIERSKKDIHLLHFYIPINATSNKVDADKATKAMNELSESLKPETTDHSSIVTQLSKKYLPITVKDLGFITVLILPYEIENLVYNLKPGNSSKVYRTKNGLHIFKNIEERKSVGEWKIAQILFALPPQTTTDIVKKNQADSIYKLLKAGANFNELAKVFSDDRLTAQNGGEMPEFRTGKFETQFETKVLELKNDGDILTPFLTSFGYHIIKRIQQTPIPPAVIDDNFRAQLKQKIEKDLRINSAKESFIKNISQQTGFKKSALLSDTELFKFADSVVKNKIAGKYSINNKAIFTIGKTIYKGIDWLNFVKDYKLNADVYKGEDNPTLLNKYIATTISDYYRKHLEEYNPAFKQQISEFKEGNLLFEIMERKVWTKASTDSIGLQKYFKEHKSNYKWVNSAAVLLFNCADVKVAQLATEALKNGKSWKDLSENSEGKIQTDSGRYELAQIQLPSNQKVEKDLISTPILNSGDNTASFVKVLKLFPDNEQRSFNEAKGLVINDYQNFLEDKWILELKKQYPIKINEETFKMLLK